MDWRINRYTAETPHGTYNLTVSADGRTDVFYHGRDGECELVLSGGKTSLDARRAAHEHDQQKRQIEAQYRARVSAILGLSTGTEAYGQGNHGRYQTRVTGRPVEGEGAPKQTAPGEPEAISDVAGLPEKATTRYQPAESEKAMASG